MAIYLSDHLKMEHSGHLCGPDSDTRQFRMRQRTTDQPMFDQFGQATVGDQVEVVPEGIFL
jgi:hypothetical protein